MKDRENSLVYKLEHQFPHPISAPFRWAQTATCGADRATGYLACVDGLLRYLGAILLSDFYSKIPSADKARQTVEPLMYPTPVKWAELIVKLAAEVVDREPFLPKLTGALVGKGGKPTRTAEDLNGLARFCYELLEEKDSLFDEKAAGALSEKLGEMTEELLSKFSFLENYPLVIFRSHGHHDDHAFHGFMLRWMGHRAHPLPINVQLASQVPLDTPVIVSEDLARGLALAPFVQLLTDLDGQADSMYLLASLRDENTLRLEAFQSSRFLIDTLEAKGEILPLPQFMETWGEGGRIASLDPTEGSSARLKFKSKLLPAEKILAGRYKTAGFIGRGGIGAVYRVYDMETGVDKAVKILYPDLSRNEFFTRYFLQTGKLLSELKHPNLVPVDEAGYSSALQENHILMDYMKGGSLQELMERREELPPRLAVSVAAPVLRALAHLHDNGLIHGGVHPGNILFKGDATPCLGDFGILKLPSARMATFRPLERIHSLRYAAPELVLGGKLTSRSDQYSVALVLYEVLTGQIPSKTQYVPPSEIVFPIPEKLDEVLAVALNPNPDARHRDAAAFATQLEAIIEEMGPEYQVNPTVQAQQLVGHLSDVHCGHMENIDKEREQMLTAFDFEGAARLLQVKIDEIWDTDEKVFWMLELAGIYFEKLDMPGKAVSIYRDCLELAPRNYVAIQGLTAHFEETGQWEELCQLLDDLGDTAGSEELQVEYLERLVEVYHHKLQDSATASAYLEKLVEKAGAKERWVKELVQMKEEAGDYTGAARALEKWLQMTSDSEQTAALVRQLSFLYYEKLDDLEAARQHLEHLVRMVPDDVESMSSLRGLYKKTFNYASLADLLRSMIDSGHYEGEQAVEMYQELGEIVSSYLYDSNEAIAVWSRLLELDPENQTALSYLERLYLREGRSEKYLEILDKKAAAAEAPDQRASILLSAAMARLEALHDVDGARKCLEEAIQLAPGHQGVEAALERLYEEHGDVEAQTRLLLSRLDSEQNRVGRMSILWKLAHLFEEGTKDMDSAAEVMKQAFKENPRDPSVRKHIEELLGDTEHVDDLMAFYLKFSLDAQEDVKEYLAGRVAHFGLNKIGEREKSRFYLEKAREQVGDNDLVLRALVAVYRDLEDWAALADILLSQAESTDGDIRDELVAEAALVVKNQLKDSKEGRAVMDRLFSVAPELADKDSLESLRAMCAALGDWDRLVSLLDKEIDKEEDPARISRLFLQLGDVYTQKKDFPQAVKTLETALRKSPNDLDLQAALETALGAAENWEGLVSFYKRLIPVTDDRKLRQAYLEKAAEIQVTVFEDLDTAAELYRQLVSLVPDKTEYYTALAGILKKVERYSDLAWLYEQVSGRLKGEEKRSVQRELAQIYFEKLENSEAALRTLRVLLKSSPGDDEAFEQAREIATQDKRFEVLLKLLSDRARHTSGEEKAGYLVQMATVSATHMGLLPPARTYLDEALTLAPDLDEAFEQYHDIMTRQEDWKGLAQLLEKMFLRVHDEPRRVEVGIELAGLFAHRLQHPVKASDVLEKVMEQAPENTQAALDLASLYGQMSQWDKAASLLVILEGLKESLSEGDRARFVFLSARTYEALLKKDQAVAAYRTAIELGYEVEAARKSLASLLYLQEDFEDSRDLIVDLLDDGDLSAEESRGFRSQLADIDARLGRMDRSREHLLAMLDKSPGDKEVLTKLIAVCHSESDAEGETRYIEQLLEVETEPDQRFALLVRLGDTARNIEALREKAAGAYEKACELKPDSKGVLLSMAQLHLEMEQFARSLELFGKVEELEPDSDKKAALAFTQGLVALEHMEDRQEAAIHLMRCLEINPSKWDAFTTLEQMAVDEADWDQQRQLYELVLGRLPSSADKDLLFTLRLNLGKVLLEKFSDSAAALEQLEAAKAIRPDNAEANRLAAGIYIQTGSEPEKAVEEYRKLLTEHPRDVKLLHQLRKAFSQMRRFDEAWCVAGVLQHLNAASPKERAFYEKLSPSNLKVKPKVISVEMFKQHLKADEEDWELTEILRTLFDRMVGRLHLNTAKDMGLTKKQAFDPTSSVLYGKVMDIVVKILGINRPQVYVRGATGYVTKEGCYPPAMVIAEDVLKEKVGKAIRFDLARTLGLFLPQHGPVGVLDRNAMRILLGNTLKVIVPSMPDPPGDPRQNAELRKQMEKSIPGVEMARVKELVGVLRTRGEDLNVKRWLVGVEKTCSRFGLLLANDFPAAAQVVESCPNQVSTASREQIVDDLIRFTITESCAKLRDHIGVTVVRA